MKALNTTMAIQCTTASLPNHEMSYCKMHRLLTCNESVMCSTVYTIKIKPLKICVRTSQLDYTENFFLLF